MAGGLFLVTSKVTGYFFPGIKGNRIIILFLLLTVPDADVNQKACEVTIA